jgi:hypothetical protein
MPKSYRLAVVVAYEDQQSRPSMEDCKRFVETGEDSMLAYWRDNAGDWFSVHAIDYYGPVRVTGIPAAAGRNVVMDAATNAVMAPLAPRDLTLVLIARAPGATYEYGADGETRALIPTDESHTFACHEFGHIVGLNHTCGIPNTGGDWIDNGQPDYFPWYGDPYDMMSAMTFGDSDPTTELPVSSAVTGFPRSRNAGPMLSRAMLHHTAPDGIATARVRHVYEDGPTETVLLNPVGSSDGTVLLAWHPADEDARGRGRVYVEYRQPFEDIRASRWDAGLSGAGPDRDRCGVIVHVAKDVPGSDYTAVWYAGRIVPQSPDEDVVVDSGRGLVTVSLIAGPTDGPVSPRVVRVQVNAPIGPYVRIEEIAQDEVRVTELPGRPLPGFEAIGPFPRERRETERTVVYTPRAFGLGGQSPYNEPTSLKVRWYLGGYMLTDPSGMAERVPNGGGPAVRLNYATDPDTGALTLSNADVVDSFAIVVECLAVDGAAEASANAIYEVEGTTEGWGEAARRFLEYWDRITNPIPKIGVRWPGWDRLEAIGLERAWQDLYAVRPEAARAVWQTHRQRLTALRSLNSAHDLSTFHAARAKAAQLLRRPSR